MAGHVRSYLTSLTIFVVFVIIITAELTELRDANDNGVSDNSNVQKVLDELEGLLKNNVDNENHLFDGIGSIDVAVYKWTPKKSIDVIEPLLQKSFGRSQVQSVAEKVSKLNGSKPLVDLKKIANESFPRQPNVPGMNPIDPTGPRNQYRIASNTKTFIGVAAHLLANRHGLNLDEKVHPEYVNMSSLGMSHSWDNPTTEKGYSNNFPSSKAYIEQITFRHLLTHTSGLSRESQKGTTKYYGSSRASTDICPPHDAYQGDIQCDQNRDSNWRAWAQHIVSYMMPNCGYKHYESISLTVKDCLPGKYFHYSNAAYAILGLALDNFLKGKNASNTLEDWISTEVFSTLNMTDTVFTWVDYTEEQKNRTVHGCQGGEELGTCNQSRALTDYSDRGMKTPPGGIWSTTTDLANYLLRLNSMVPMATSAGIYAVDPTFSPKHDEQSEEESSQMPQFKYGHGWYISENFTCSAEGKYQHHFHGAWGTVPGFTSFMMTNFNPNDNSTTRYAIVMLRSYNFAGRFNLGNQARRYLWRLLHPEVRLETLQCPVAVLDHFSAGDKKIEDQKKESASNYLIYTRPVIIMCTMLTLLLS